MAFTLAARCWWWLWGIAEGGEKHVLGVWQGATENTTVVKGLLEDLVERGLNRQRPSLVVAARPKKSRRSASTIHSDTLCISFHTLRKASFVDRPRRYPKLEPSNTGSKMGSNQLSRACWHTRS